MSKFSNWPEPSNKSLELAQYCCGASITKMKTQNKMSNKPYDVVTWDWKSQPDWDEINFALIEIPNSKIFPVESGTDQFAVVVGDADLTTKTSQRLFDEWRWSKTLAEGIVSIEEMRARS